MSALLKTERRAEQMRLWEEFFSQHASSARPEDVPILRRAAEKCAAGARDAQREPAVSPETYPQKPGHRGGDTDKAAASAVAGAARSYEAMALTLITDRPLTGDEVHLAIEAKLEHPVPQYSIRPRLSALVAKGLAVDSGERRPSSAGRCMARVYRATTVEERALHAARRAMETDDA